jgi:hypothetical protein
MTMKNNTHLRASLTTLLDDGHPELPLEQAVMENYERYKSVTKVAKVLSRYYGKHIPQYKVSHILKDKGITVRGGTGSIYDLELSNE